jgi:histidyl-tRNA synthetase
LKVNSPRGTADIYGEDIEYRNYVINTARKIFEKHNYREIITPAFEYTRVFSRSIGEGSDIVKKEMYTFSDRKGRSLTLRPEGTASIARAVIENKMYAENLPLKLFYAGNMFRYERPQKGRMREFWQVGIESIGTDSPVMDAEVMWILNSLFEELGFKKLLFKVNSIGCPVCREKFIAELKKYLEPRLEKLCDDCRDRFNVNALRIFDCKKSGCIKILKKSPEMYSYLCPDCKRNFEEILKCLKELKINFMIDKNLVRGFDYYTGTIFEIVSEDLQSAQNALGGGGRYDNLIKQLGGPDIPATGFAVGVDRTIMLMKQLKLRYKKEEDSPGVYLIVLNKKYQLYSLKVLKYLRDSGVVCDINFNDRSLKKEIRSAGKNNYSFIIIIGEDEIKSGKLTLKNIKKFRQYSVDWKNEKEKILKIIGVHV